MKRIFNFLHRIRWLSLAILFNTITISSDNPVHNQDKLSLLELPGPLFGVGQNIVPKRSTFISGIVYQTKGKEQYDFTELWFPRILYGIRDDLSIQLTVPTTVRAREGDSQSSGLEDIRVTVEYEFYHKEFNARMFRATFLGALFFPTGSVIKSPPTGFGSGSFFTGFTMAYFSNDWYFFTSDFVQITSDRHDIKAGDRFIYQGGGGRHIKFFDKVLITLLLEWTGFLDQKDIVYGNTDLNSGGNTIFAGPSLYIATETVYFQAGIIFPILQRLNGNQPPSSYIWGLYLGYRL